MEPSVERFLRSMQAAGVRRIPAPRASAAPPPARSGREARPDDEARRTPPAPASTAPARPAPSPPAKESAAAQPRVAPTAPRAGAARPFSGTRSTIEPVADPAAELQRVAAEVLVCRACGLCETRTPAVPGEGNPRARVLFVGEGPGADEDRTGRPFVGRAGQLLDDIITKGMKLRREDVYICNVVKCRPPGNRVPAPEEMAACAGWLDRQIAAVRPAVICTLGATAARRLLNDDRPMGALRGHTWEFQGIPVIATYHPAYLLRNPAAKPETWKDIQRVMELARGP
jgi:uracil-DNA glycosylase family 4